MDRRIGVLLPWSRRIRRGSGDCRPRGFLLFQAIFVYSNMLNKGAVSVDNQPTSVSVDYLSGISLGQANEFTALAIIERSTPQVPGTRQRPPSSFSVRHLERFPIGTSYPEIFDRVSERFASPPLLGRTHWSRTKPLSAIQSSGF